MRIRAPRAGAPFGAFTGAFVIAAVLGGSNRWIPESAALAGMCAFVLLWSWWTNLRGAVFAVICGALFADGFIIDRVGTLTWNSRYDGEWLSAIAAAALLGLLLRGVISRRPRTVRRPPEVHFLDQVHHRSTIS